MLTYLACTCYPSFLVPLLDLLLFINVSYSQMTPSNLDGEERLGLCRDVSCDADKSVEKLKIITVYITIGLAPEKEKKKQRKNVNYSALRDHKLLNTTTVVLKCS